MKAQHSVEERALRNVEPGRTARCDSCEAVVPSSELAKSLYEIDSLEDRLVPGSEIPAGECKCGALAYLVRKGDQDLHARINRLRAAVENDKIADSLLIARSIVTVLRPFEFK